METISWEKAKEVIENIKNKKIIFDNKKINWKDAIIFAKLGFKIPIDLIDNEIEKIDYSEIPSVSEKDIKQGKYTEMKSIMLMIKKENYDFVIKNKLDLTKIINSYILINSK